MGSPQRFCGVAAPGRTVALPRGVASGMDTTDYDSNEQRRPRIADGVIVWVDDRHQPYGTEIYAHEIATGKQYRLTEDFFIQGSPTISGGRIIWQDSRYDQTELYMFSPRQ